MPRNGRRPTIPNDKCLELYKHGKTVSKISKELKCSLNSVYRSLRRSGVVEFGKINKWRDEKVAEMYKSGMTMDEVANEFGFKSLSGVFNALRRTGTDSRKFWSGFRDGANRKCSYCKIVKSMNNFCKNNGAPRGHGYVCSDCRHSRHLKNYGVTKQEYEAMLERQDGKCAICFSARTCNKRLCVDHCHKTGKVRGLLCSNCNVGIGNLQDSADVLMSAASYIKLHSM